MHDYQEGGRVKKLQNYYRQKEANPVEIYNYSIWGNTSVDVLSRFERECEEWKVEKVIFAIGINDSLYIQDPQHSAVSLQVFEETIQALISTARKYTSKIIFIGLTSVDESKVCPIPYSKHQCFSNENIQKYDNKLKKITTENTVPYIYMFDALPNEELQDGLHPDGAGHERMFERVRDFLTQ